MGNRFFHFMPTIHALLNNFFTVNQKILIWHFLAEIFKKSFLSDSDTFVSFIYGTKECGADSVQILC